jgi:glycosyltransferase involved in cell wall biosynthesis
VDQTYDKLEIIVVDDAPDHPIGSDLEDIADSRIRYICLPERKGAGASRNIGIDMAKGQYVSFLDDDDIYLEEKIEKQVEVFERSSPSVGLVYCGYAYRDETNRIIWTTVPRKSKWRNLYHTEFIGIAPLIKRECLDDVGVFDEELIFFEDVDLWFRISKKYDFGLCREILYEAAAHSNTKSVGRLNAKLTSLDRYYRKYGQEFRSSSRVLGSRVLSNYHMERALSYFHFGMLREMKKEVVKSLRSYPFSFKCWKLYIFWLGRKWMNQEGPVAQP